MKRIHRGDKRLTYSYDVMGRRLAMRDHDDGRWTCTHDVAGRLTRLENAKGETTSFSHDVNDRMVGKKLAECLICQVGAIAVIYGTRSAAGAARGDRSLLFRTPSPWMGAWFKKVAGTVVRSTLRAVPATVPVTSLNHAGWGDLVCRPS